MTTAQNTHHWRRTYAAAALAGAIAMLTASHRAVAQPVQSAQLSPIKLSVERRQLIGLKFATVEEQELTDRLDTSGTVEMDERRQSYVQTRVAGWIRNVHADQAYAHVNKGETLFTIYSPDLVGAEQDFILARKQEQQVALSPVQDVKDGATSIASAALDRLRLYGVSHREIARLEREGTARDTIEIEAPGSGYITDRAALPNMYVQPDTRLYTIADLSRVWVDAAVFQDQIGKIKRGDKAVVHVDAYPGRSFEGQVDAIWPVIDPMTRTARVRCSFANQAGLLKPAMFVNVQLMPTMGRGLVIPDSGVLRTGVHNTVFVNKGDGYLEPVEVELGAHVGDRFEVRNGLHAGQEIVASANFLIDSESQLQAALGSFVPPPPGVSASASPASAATVEMTTDPNPPQRGSNVVRIALADSSGKPIEGAEVSVGFFMPAMPAMQMAAMKAQAKATEKTPGHYVAQVELQSGGTWQVTVSASKSGRQVASSEFSVTATGPMM